MEAREFEIELEDKVEGIKDGTFCFELVLYIFLNVFISKEELKKMKYKVLKLEIKIDEIDHKGLIGKKNLTFLSSLLLDF